MVVVACWLLVVVVVVVEYGKRGSFERMKSFRNVCRRQEERGIRRRLVRVLLFI